MNLQEILVDETMQTSGDYTSIDGVLFHVQDIVCICPPAKAGAFVIPEGTVAIESEAFSGCSALTCITIPDSVEQVGADAFINCTGLERIEGTIPVSCLQSFKGCKSLKELSLTSDDRITALVLDDLDSLEQVNMGGAGLFSLGLHVQNCSSLKSFRVPEAEDGMFTSYLDANLSLKLKMIVNDCPALQELYGPSYIASAGITGCTDLEKIVFLKNAGGSIRISDCPSVTTILNYADGTTFFFNDDNTVNAALAENPDLMVYGYENSSTKNTCSKYSVPFRAFGDVNGDESVDIVDVILVNKYLMIGTPLDEASTIAADVDDSGEIDHVDSLNILKYLIHIIDSFGVQ